MNENPEDMPSEKEMMKFLGGEAGRIWKEITHYLSENYEFDPVREKGDFDSTIRYRRGGKTLITFYPKEGELTVLIIFGKKEAEKFEDSRDEFSSEIVRLFDDTRQYHDGKWLHIRVPPFHNVEDIKKMLHIKRRPKKAA